MTSSLVSREIGRGGASHIHGHAREHGHDDELVGASVPLVVVVVLNLQAELQVEGSKRARGVILFRELNHGGEVQDQNGARCWLKSEARRVC